MHDRDPRRNRSRAMGSCIRGRSVGPVELRKFPKGIAQEEPFIADTAWVTKLRDRQRNLIRVTKVYLGHKARPGGVQDKTITVGCDPAPTGIEGDSVVWWLGKEVSSREGRARGISLRGDVTPTIWRYRRDTCWNFTALRFGPDLRPRCPINIPDIPPDLRELIFLERESVDTDSEEVEHSSPRNWPHQIHLEKANHYKRHVAFVSFVLLLLLSPSLDLSFIPVTDHQLIAPLQLTENPRHLPIAEEWTFAWLQKTNIVVYSQIWSVKIISLRKYVYFLWWTQQN